MKLIAIPKHDYESYRLDVIFDGYKWDPQFADVNTVADHVLVLTEAEHLELMDAVENLAQETSRAETFLNQNRPLAKPLRLSKKTRSELHRMSNYECEKHVRLMRFDFHPTADGWALSEVNSDVPGGFAESSIMPKIAAKYLDDSVLHHVDFGDALVQALCEKVKPKGRIAMVHCTSYSDDRQVMQFLGDILESKGFEIIQCAADHLHFENLNAYSVLSQNEGPVDGIVRFNPMEWVTDIKPKRWAGYFDTQTPSCNHPIAIYAQTKRFPLIWDTLEAHGLDFTTWRKYLPETTTVRGAKGRQGYIYKPVWGRVGEGISIEESCRDDEYKQIMKAVRRKPWKYIAQQKFESQPLIDQTGKIHHICVGAYSIDGKAAGYYARTSTTPRIDSYAQDIPVLIERTYHDK